MSDCSDSMDRIVVEFGEHIKENSQEGKLMAELEKQVLEYL